MDQPAVSSVAKAISELEKVVGKLSTVQKTLLETDGLCNHLAGHGNRSASRDRNGSAKDCAGR